MQHKNETINECIDAIKITICIITYFIMGKQDKNPSTQIKNDKFFDVIEKVLCNITYFIMLKQDESPSNPNKNNKCVDTSEKVLCNINNVVFNNIKTNSMYY